jgi:uncharacterized protein YpmB
MKRVFAIAVFISAVILLLIIIFSKSRSPFGKANSDFSVKPEKEITRIVLSQNGLELKLEKSGEEWLINDKVNARKSGISFIIMILTEAKIKSPVSPGIFSNEITEKDISSVTVKVYEGRKMLKSFMIYKTASNVYGNIMKLNERAKPFIVHVPGNEVNIGSAFTINELFWQPFTIFNMLPSEISSVNFENIADTSSSFSITKKEGGYSFSATGSELSGWDPSLVIRYLSYFTWIPFESWAFDLGNEEKAQAEKKDPLFRITLVSSAGYTTILSLWEKTKYENGEEKTDTDRLLGKTQASDHFFIIRYFDIDPVLKKRSYFFPD